MGSGRRARRGKAQPAGCVLQVLLDRIPYPSLFTHDSSLLLQFITQGFDRNNRLIERREFLLESSDVDVDSPRRSVVIVSPDGIEEDVSCQDSAGIAQEMFEQAEFFRREGDFYLLHGDFVSREIHDEIAIAILGRAVVWFPLKPSKEGLDAGNQGFGAKWFGDVVVGSQLQANDGVRFLS